MNNPLLSLIILSIAIVLFFSWLVNKTLREGEEALKKMGNDTK